jgi:hypothetical protein
MIAGIFPTLMHRQSFMLGAKENAVKIDGV